MNQRQFHGIRHLLLDIEGTTCPVHFVGEVLFPYASAQMVPDLREHQEEEEIHRLLVELQTCWMQETEPEAIALRDATADGQGVQGVVGVEGMGRYLQWLIARDRKLTPLKDLQGRIWEQGYRKGHLVAPLYADVPEALLRWHGKGLQLAVYSSGSIQAQQLLYGHTEKGDLRPLFTHWFDTHSGAKNQASSYRNIAASMLAEPHTILFISDFTAELEAAGAAGLDVLFSDREGNPRRDPKGFPSVTDFQDLNF
jgi:enolase-phosphatase E1